MWLTAAAAAATASSVAFLAATAFFVLAACDQREREGWKKGGKVGAESLSGDGRMADEYRQLAINTPSTKLDVFLEMLFNERDEWVMFDTTEQEREFDCDSEFSDRWMIEGMKKIYDVPEPQQWCATSYANRE